MSSSNYTSDDITGVFGILVIAAFIVAFLAAATSLNEQQAECRNRGGIWHSGYPYGHNVCLRRDAVMP